MLFLRMLKRVARIGSSALLILTVLHFFLFWFMLRATEAPDARIIGFIDYWYYWWTTVLTVGYGDLSPQSALGRLFTPVFEFTGIMLLAAWLTKTGNVLIDYQSRKRRGLMPTDAIDHIVVVGDYDSADVRNLLTNAIADATDDGKTPTIVGCFRNTGEHNPFHGKTGYGRAKLEYVQASSSGFTRQVLCDAGVERARQIYVTAADDTVAIGVVCILSQLRVRSRVAVILRKEESVDMVPHSGLDLVVVRPVTAALAVREMEDPGTGSVIQELLSAGVGHSLYSCPVRLARTYGEAEELCRNAFGSRMIVLGFSRKDAHGAWQPSLAPDRSTQLEENDQLIYVAERDLSSEEEGRFIGATAA